MSDGPFITSGVVQGFGMGLVFVPLSTLAFATLPPRYRTDGTGLFSLVRNVGSGVSISMVTTVLAQMSQVNHAELAERISLNSQVVRDAIASKGSGVLSQINGLVSQQSAMIAYLDDFQLMMYVTLLSIPIIFLLRKPKAVKVDPTHISE